MKFATEFGSFRISKPATDASIHSKKGEVGTRQAPRSQGTAPAELFKQEQGVQLQRKEYEEHRLPRLDDAASKHRVNAREMAGTKTGKAVFQPGGKSF